VFTNEYECTIDQELANAAAAATTRRFVFIQQTAAVFLDEMTSWLVSCKRDVKSKIWLRRSMHLYSGNILAKFHPDPIWNERSLKLFWRGRPNNNNNKNKMSGDMMWVLDIKTKLTLRCYFVFLQCIFRKMKTLLICAVVFALLVVMSLAGEEKEKSEKEKSEKASKGEWVRNVVSVSTFRSRGAFSSDFSPRYQQACCHQTV